MGLWKEYHRGKMPFSSHDIKDTCMITGLITDGVKLDHLAKVVFVRFLHCKVTNFFPSFHKVLFGRKLLCAVQT